MTTLRVNIRAIGNSKGVVLPKPVLTQVGLDGATEAVMTVEGDAIVLRKPPSPAREGWADAAKRLAAQGDDVPVMGEFGNEGDADLQW